MFRLYLFCLIFLKSCQGKRVSFGGGVWRIAKLALPLHRSKPPFGPPALPSCLGILVEGTKSRPVHGYVDLRQREVPNGTRDQKRWMCRAWSNRPSSLTVACDEAIPPSKRTAAGAKHSRRRSSMYDAGPIRWIGPPADDCRKASE